MTLDELDDTKELTFVQVEETTVYSFKTEWLREVAKEQDMADDLTQAAWVLISQGDVLDSKIRDSTITKMSQ